MAITATNHPEIVDLHRTLFPNTCYGLGEWRRYIAGIWEPVTELTIRREIQEIARRSYDGNVTAAVVSSVHELLKAMSFVDDRLFDADPNVIAFDDCILNLTTMKSQAHSPTHYQTAKLPYPYDPTAECPAYSTFLDSVLSPAIQQFFWEFAGYCVTPVTKYEIALWLWGPPGGGKSTCIQGLQTMLGHKSCILGINEIERSSFGLIQLPGKTLAISTEQPGGFVKTPHLINAIISGEPIPVDRKFRDQITITPRAKLVWGMNELPRVDTSGVGLFRRVVPIHFDSVPVAQRDPTLKDRISTEGPGICNMALRALTTLQGRGKFLIPDELETERETYRVQNDVPQLFVTEMFDLLEGESVKSSTVYQLYVGWAKRNNHGVQSATAFAGEMKRLGFKKQKREAGMFWQGLKVRIDDGFNPDDYRGLDLPN